MVAVYTWDRENISAIASRLEAEMRNLDEQKKNLVKYKAQAAEAYQGDTAQQFQANLEADISNMGTVMEMVRQQSQKLRNIADKHYRECEEKLQERVRLLDGEIV